MVSDLALGIEIYERELRRGVGRSFADQSAPRQKYRAD
jgi:hypothetical protein